MLAAMAHDVLTVHVSTVTPEEVFSKGGRVLNKEKSSLEPELLEAIICLRDWYLARERLHEQDEKNKLALDMEKMRIVQEEDEEE